MSYIDIQKMRIVQERLKKQIRGLTAIYEQITETERKVKKLSYTSDVRQRLKKARREIQEEIQVLKAIEQCVKISVQKYQRAENQIQDIYYLETRSYPRPRFGITRIRGMELLRSLEGMF